MSTCGDSVWANSQSIMFTCINETYIPQCFQVGTFVFEHLLIGYLCSWTCILGHLLVGYLCSWTCILGHFQVGYLCSLFQNIGIPTNKCPRTQVPTQKCPRTQEHFQVRYLCSSFFTYVLGHLFVGTYVLGHLLVGTYVLGHYWQLPASVAVKVF